jgi:hypothetical protein
MQVGYYWQRAEDVESVHKTRLALHLARTLRTYRETLGLGSMPLWDQPQVAMTLQRRRPHQPSSYG